MLMSRFTYPGLLNADILKNKISKDPNNKKQVKGMKYNLCKSPSSEFSHVKGNRKTPVKSITMRNSIKKNAAVNSFLSIFFNGYLIFIQVQIDHLWIKIYQSSSVQGLPFGILSIGNSFLLFLISRLAPFKRRILMQRFQNL